MHCPGCRGERKPFLDADGNWVGDCPGVTCPQCAEKDAEIEGIRKRFTSVIKARDYDNLMLRDEIARLKFCVEADEYADRLYKQAVEIAHLRALVAVGREMVDSVDSLFTQAPSPLNEAVAKWRSLEGER